MDEKPKEELNFGFKDGVFSIGVKAPGMSFNVGMGTGMNDEQFKQVFGYSLKQAETFIEKLKDKNSEEYALIVTLGKAQGKSDEEIAKEIQETIDQHAEQKAKFQEFMDNIGKEKSETTETKE